MQYEHEHEHCMMTYVCFDTEFSIQHEHEQYDSCIEGETECDFYNDRVQYDCCRDEEYAVYEDLDVTSQSQQNTFDSKNDSMIYKQNIDGSCYDFDGIDIGNVKKFGKKIAIIHINILYQDKLGQFSLIIRKALKFLEKQNDNDLAEIILQLRNDLKI